MTRRRPLVTMLMPAVCAALLTAAAGPLPRATRDTVVQFPFGISVAVPSTWTSTTPMIAQAIARHRPMVDATSLEPQEDGSLIFLQPANSTEEASVIIMILPTGVGQEALAAMSEADVADAERRWFRPEAEQAAGRTGRRITAWLGTARGIIGGRHGLITRYSFTRTDGPPLRKETYAVYLGGKQVVFHIHLPASAGTTVEAEIRRMLASAHIATGFLK